MSTKTREEVWQEAQVAMEMVEGVVSSGFEGFMKSGEITSLSREAFNSRFVHLADHISELGHTERESVLKVIAALLDVIFLLLDGGSDDEEEMAHELVQISMLISVGLRTVNRLLELGPDPDECFYGECQQDEDEQ